MKKIKNEIVESAVAPLQSELDSLQIKVECLMDNTMSNGNFKVRIYDDSNLSMFSGLFSLENNSRSELESKIGQATNMVIQELKSKIARETFYGTIVDSEVPVGVMDFYGME